MNIDIGPWQVRSLRPEDETSLARYANNRKIWRNLRDAFPHPYTLADARQFIATVRAQTPEMVFCIATSDEAIGAIGYRILEDVERISAEIGYWLAEEYWGQGITTAALRAVTAYAMCEHDLKRIFAEPYAWNPASFRVLEKAGYVLEGRMRCRALKDGQVVDQLLYAFTQDDCGDLA